MTTSISDIMTRLQSLAEPDAIAGMARFGITSTHIYGVSAQKIRQFAKELGKNHALAQELWATGNHDARILACFVADKKQVDVALMERWARDFDNWAIVDACCMHLFGRTIHAYDKAVEWSARPEEFVKRAGFVLMVTIAVHDKKAPDEILLSFLPILQREAHDERNFVKKAINWTLRQIGKRNPTLNAAAIETAQAIAEMDSKAARWIAKDALRELQSAAIQTRLQKKGK